jgi:serine/threonine protein kinase
MHADLSTRPSFVNRFLREAQLAAMLEHPSIVTIHDVDQLGDDIQIVMAWVDGEDLQKTIRREGALPLDRVARILDQIAAGLDHAHHQPQPVYHRDVKPANIMLAPGDRVVLTDFGIAKLIGDTSLTGTGQVVGSPEYMAPEQVEGAEVDHRSDLYSLGVVLYEMLTGRTPFRADTPLAVLHAQLYTPPPSPRTVTPSLPPSVERVVLKALAKDPSERYRSAREMATAFRDAVGSQGA